MFQIPAYTIVAGLASLVAALAATFLVRAFARRFNFVAKPKLDRWHKKPTAMLGGAAIFIATAAMYAVFGPKSQDALVIFGGSAFLFLVGLVDDILNIKPYQKLIGQLIGASIIVGFGMKLPLTGFEIIDIWLTVFWLVGITNAINLLDNMDGLAAGISAIAAISLAIGFGVNGQVDELTLIVIFIGALLGFLAFNFNPASIFMGDCGSMFVGFLLASSVLLNQTGARSRGIFSILAVPVLILFVPIFDTTFVTILRKLWGRKASQGGRDHTSHRLVALGLSERAAVLMLYLFATMAGFLSLLVSRIGTVNSLALVGVFTIVLTIIGVYLSKVKVYEEQQEDLAMQNNAMHGFLVNISYKRRIFEVFLDALLITLSYYAGYSLLFGNFEETSNWNLFIQTLPLLIVLKLATFLVMGVYRGIWRYTSISDFLTFTKAVVASSVLSVFAILLVFRFQNFSRTVFIIDGLILLIAIVISRMAFRIIRQFLPMPLSREGRRVLIYGAGDGGEMVLRELKNNPEWNYQPVGFVDDDPLKKDKMMNGLRVYPGNGSLPAVLGEKDVQEVLISFRNISPERMSELKEVCRDANVSLKRALLKIEPVDFE